MGGHPSRLLHGVQQREGCFLRTFTGASGRTGPQFVAKQYCICWEIIVRFTYCEYEIGKGRVGVAENVAFSKTDSDRVQVILRKSGRLRMVK